MSNKIYVYTTEHTDKIPWLPSHNKYRVGIGRVKVGMTKAGRSVEDRVKEQFGASYAESLTGEANYTIHYEKVVPDQVTDNVVRRVLVSSGIYNLRKPNSSQSSEWYECTVGEAIEAINQAIAKGINGKIPEAILSRESNISSARLDAYYKEAEELRKALVYDSKVNSTDNVNIKFGIDKREIIEQLEKELRPVIEKKIRAEIQPRIWSECMQKRRQLITLEEEEKLQESISNGIVLSVSDVVRAIHNSTISKSEVEEDILKNACLWKEVQRIAESNFEHFRDKLTEKYPGVVSLMTVIDDVVYTGEHKFFRGGRLIPAKMSNDRYTWYFRVEE